MARTFILIKTSKYFNNQIWRSGVLFLSHASEDLASRYRVCSFLKQWFPDIFAWIYSNWIKSGRKKCWVLFLPRFKSLFPNKERQGKLLKIVRCPGDSQIRRWFVNRWNHTTAVLLVTIVLTTNPCMSLAIWQSSNINWLPCHCILKISKNHKMTNCPLTHLCL